MATKHKFTLKKGSKEFPDRFGGLELEYSYPADYAALTKAAERVLSTWTPEEGKTKPTVEELLYNLGMNQSGHLNVQKAIKAFLDSEEAEKMDIPTATAAAIAEGERRVVTVPGTRRGEGKVARAVKAEARAATAEKKVDAAVASLEAAYLAMPKAARASFAERLVGEGILTKDRLAELDKQGK